MNAIWAVGELRTRFHLHVGGNNNPYPVHLLFAVLRCYPGQLLSETPNYTMCPRVKYWVWTQISVEMSDSESESSCFLSKLNSVLKGEVSLRRYNCLVTLNREHEFSCIRTA